jgi:hypothetical protein
MKHSIAIKIFSLALGILLLMIVVAIINSIAVLNLGREVEQISITGIPIMNHSSDLNEAGLRRRIAFERLNAQYLEVNPDYKVVGEAKVNFQKFTLLVNKTIALLKQDLTVVTENPEDNRLYNEARDLVSQIEIIFQQQSEYTKQILEKRKLNEDASIVDLFKINANSQKLLQDKRSALQNTAFKIAENSVMRSRLAKKRVLLSSMLSTSSLGLGFRV